MFEQEQIVPLAICDISDELFRVSVDDLSDLSYLDPNVFDKTTEPLLLIRALP